MTGWGRGGGATSLAGLFLKSFPEAAALRCVDRSSLKSVGSFPKTPSFLETSLWAELTASVKRGGGQSSGKKDPL